MFFYYLATIQGPNDCHRFGLFFLERSVAFDLVIIADVKIGECHDEEDRLCCL